ncbi:MAG: hypothetical protein QNK35_15155 [Bacteroides sp.]|nr:hypothetical protein [Bacteroides sp.]
MDFDIGNILYVVITLVAIIASLLGKKKKPAGKTTKPGFFENLEQVFKMGQEDPELTDLREHEPDLVEEEVEVDYQYVKEEPVVISKGPSMMEEYESLLSNRGAKSAGELQMEGARYTGEMEVTQLDDEEDPDYFDIVSDFDARTAVVYSAIINRVNY